MGHVCRAMRQACVADHIVVSGGLDRDTLPEGQVAPTVAVEVKAATDRNASTHI